LLLSHGLAVKAYRELDLRGQIGISLNLKPVYSLDPESAAQVTMEDEQKNKYYLDPILLGKYPESFGTHSFIKEGDMSLIQAPIDFLGVNYYSRLVISKDEFTPKEANCMGWENYPEGFYDLLKRLHRDYPTIPSIVITENGYADYEAPSVSEPIHDIERIKYIQSHLEAVSRAKSEGVPIKGYIVWSLLDNLEWSFGYAPRFGLVHVDFSTQKRTPKESFYFYQEIIKSNLVSTHAEGDKRTSSSASVTSTTE
jgi:beta-glucosidase